MGGLTVLREIAKVLPGQDTIYLGDTARVPYGVRSPETIKRYARENAQFLFDQGIRALVVVLGCTHYPLLRATIAAALAPGVSIVDSAQSMAAEVAKSFPDPGGKAQRKFFVTDAPERFARIGARFLGHPLDDVTHVNL